MSALTDVLVESTNPTTAIMLVGVVIYMKIIDQRNENRINNVRERIDRTRERIKRLENNQWQTPGDD